MCPCIEAATSQHEQDDIDQVNCTESITISKSHIVFFYGNFEPKEAQCPSYYRTGFYQKDADSTS